MKQKEQFDPNFAQNFVRTHGSEIEIATLEIPTLSIYSMQASQKLNLPACMLTMLQRRISIPPTITAQLNT